MPFMRTSYAERTHSTIRDCVPHGLSVDVCAMHISAPEIREAVAADAGRVVALLGDQLADHSVRPSPTVLDAAVRRVIERPRLARILVAMLNGEIVGVAAMSFVLTLEHGGLGAWLEELYV